MKSKVIVSLLLAVLMLGALVTPVLADRAAGDFGDGYGGEPGTGKYSVRTTHDNRLKVTVSLRGAMPNSTYEVRVHSPSPLSYTAQAGTFMTDSRGNGRFSRFAVTDYPTDLTARVFDAGTYWFQIIVDRLGTARFDSLPVIQITFK